VRLRPKDTTWPISGLPKQDIGAERNELMCENEPGDAPSDNSYQRFLRPFTSKGIASDPRAITPPESTANGRIFNKTLDIIADSNKFRLP